MGAVGGGIWHSVKGAKNSPKVSIFIRGLGESAKEKERESVWVWVIERQSQRCLQLSSCRENV